MATQNKYFIKTGVIIGPTSKFDILVKEFIGIANYQVVLSTTINPLEALSFENKKEAVPYLQDNILPYTKDEFEIIVISFIQ